MPSVKRKVAPKLLLGPEHPLQDRFTEAFVQHLLSNPEVGDSEVYREVANDTTLEPHHRRSAKLILMRPEVAARIHWLKEQQASRSEISRDELQSFFAAVIRTPIAEVTPEHRIAHKVEYHENGAVKRVEMPDKLAAAGHLMRMNGWDKAQTEGPSLHAAEMVVFAVVKGTYQSQP